MIVITSPPSDSPLATLVQGLVRAWSTVDVGSVADFLNVGASIAVGVAVWSLSRRTFQLQHSVEEEKRVSAAREADLMLIFLSAELFSVRDALKQLNAIVQAINKGDPKSDPKWRSLLDVAKYALTSQIDHDRHRLHLLKNPTGAQLARVAGFGWTLQKSMEVGFATDDAKRFVGALAVGTPKVLADLDAIIAEVRAARGRLGIPKVTPDTPTE